LKAQIAKTFEEQLAEEKKWEVASTLFEIIGQASVDAYISKVRGFLDHMEALARERSVG
jgi:hypothetical protein